MPDSLKLSDFLDEEFLALVVDLGDNEGWVSTQTIAEAVQLGTRNVGSRFAWMKRYGVVERDTRVKSPTKGFWRLTEMGEAVVKARFTVTQKKALDNVKDDQLWVLTGELAGRYEGVSNAAANLIRRRFSVSVKRRKYL